MEKTVARILAWIDTQDGKQQIIIAIDGSCTSGKSTLAEKLTETLDCNLFRMDDFFLRPEQRTKERLSEAGGNIDYERFREEVLIPLKSGNNFSYRPFDCRTGTLADPVAVMPKRINIIEGSYSHHPFFGNVYDLKVILTVSEEIRRQRIKHRPSFLHRKFFESWIPMEQRYFEAFSVLEKADLVTTPEDNQE